MEPVEIQIEEEELKIQRTFTVQISKRLYDFLTDFAIWVGVSVDEVLEQLITDEILRPFQEDNEFIVFWVAKALENRIDKAQV